MFGASLMTLLSLLRRKEFSGTFSNSVLGVLSGLAADIYARWYAVMPVG
jgi:hypothetical protein